MNGNFWYRSREDNRRIPKVLPSLLVAAFLFLLIVVTAFCAQPDPRPQQSLTVWDGVYTAEQAKRGLEVGAKECGRCHGKNLIDGDPSASTLIGDAFLSHWEDLTVGDLFERTRGSMPEEDPGKLSNQQYADIIACILSINKFPAGKTELSSQPEMLKRIVIKEMDPRPKEPSPEKQKPASNSGK